MKTLAVLSALATIAFAAPGIEVYKHNTRFSPGDFVITQREKKSTPVETQNVPEHLEDHTLDQVSHQVGASNPDERTFGGFKKQIFINKKVGYHAYRDDEQPQTDSQEKCRKKMKLELCDDNDSKDKVKSASVDNPHEEMHHSISIAKEAVHTFERDLEKMENECAENKHSHSTLGSDVQLHHDIEKARQALENIQRQFKNFDSLTHTADDNTSKPHLKTVKSDEERMIQWKEAGNFNNNVEISKNLEDNFKNTELKDESKQINLNRFNNGELNNRNKEFKSTIEDIDVPARTNNNFEDGMTSIVEDKNRNLKIHSDSLTKDSATNEGSQLKENNLSRMEHHIENTMAANKEIMEKHAEPNKHDVSNHHLEVHETKERNIENMDKTPKFVETKGNELNMPEKQNRNQVDNIEMLKTSDDRSSLDMHARTKLEKELEKGPSHTKLMHENVDSVSNGHSRQNMRSEGVSATHEDVAEQKDKNNVHLNHNNFEHRTSLFKDTEAINREHLRNDAIEDNIPSQMDLTRSTQIQALPKKFEEHTLKNEDGLHMDTQRTTNSMSKTVNENDNEKTHFKNHEDSHMTKDLSLLRATSDFHKELLNNMDFIEDSHHTHSLHQPSLTDKGQIMKNEHQELHERLNVPEVQPNSDHLKTMMHFSDNTHHANSQLKMASLFNNDDTNFNLQFNSPQDFVQQSNVDLFRSMGDINDKTELDLKLKTMHEKDDMPTELHDPLTVHRAHSDNMRMEGSSQHFNIEKLNPSRSNSMLDQRLNLNEQMRSQQRWPQAKSMNTHQLAPMNIGFEHMHGQDAFVSRHNGHNMMVHEKSNVDSTMQPSSFSQMRGASKMALEQTGPNQWAHTHGAYRSSYGPSLSPSYGAGSSYGGSAVGVFPNANVGNCAVPILLSCSPSVVSGSLAKTQSAYSPPAYRSEDFNIHKKRGVDVDEVNLGTQLGHTLQAQRPNVILDKNNNTV